VSPTDFDFYAGIDWGSRSHTVCRIRADGRGRREREFPHSLQGLHALADFLGQDTDASAVAVAIELPRGAVVDLLQLKGFAVFTLNPKQLDRFRDRHTVSGAKDDRLDAYVLADALRTDRHKYTELAAPDEEALALRETTRRLETVQRELRRHTNRLWGCVNSLWPQLLAFCPGADEPWFWALLERAAEPQKAASVRRSQVRAILQRYGKRSVRAEDVIAVLKQGPLALRPVNEWLLLGDIATYLPIIATLFAQAELCERHVRELAAEGGRLVEIVDSFKGIGPATAATLVGEAGQLLAAGELAGLRMLAGTAPVTRRSGKSGIVTMRRACNGRLRNAVRSWARTAITHDPLAHAHYQALRERGKAHERALRGVGDRLLAALVAAIRRDELYDPTRRISKSVGLET